MWEYVTCMEATIGHMTALNILQTHNVKVSHKGPTEIREIIKTMNHMAWFMIAHTLTKV